MAEREVGPPYPSTAFHSRRSQVDTPMTAVTLEQAERFIDAIIARGAALNCRP
jgi:hypothetical protein